MPHQDEKKQIYKLLLINGDTTRIDACFKEELSQFKWRISKAKADKVGYVKRNIRVKGKMTTEFLHRKLTGAKKGDIVDHINGNTLDNRLCNLRIVTPKQNMMNRKVKGYCFNKNLKKWEVKIGIDYKTVIIGYFTSEEDAKEARRLAEITYFKEYARKV